MLTPTNLTSCISYYASLHTLCPNNTYIVTFSKHSIYSNYFHLVECIYLVSSSSSFNKHFKYHLISGNFPRCPQTHSCYWHCQIALHILYCLNFNDYMTNDNHISYVLSSFILSYLYIFYIGPLLTFLLMAFFLLI